MGCGTTFSFRILISGNIVRDATAVYNTACLGIDFYLHNLGRLSFTNRGVTAAASKTPERLESSVTHLHGVDVGYSCVVDVLLVLRIVLVAFGCMRSRDIQVVFDAG